MSGSGGQRGGKSTQHQGHGSSSSRGSHGKGEHRGTGAPSGRSQNRRGGGSSQSRGREAEAGGRREQTGRAPFQRCPPLSLDLTGPYNLAEGSVQSQERGRPVRTASANRFVCNDERRGGRNKSQGRTGNFPLHPMRNPSGIRVTSVPNRRPLNSTPSRNTTKNEDHSYRGQLGPSHRVSRSNLSDLDYHSQSRDRRPRRGETTLDSDHKFSHRLDVRSLGKILQMEPSEVVMKLAAPGSGLKEFLDRKDTTDNLTHITLDVLSKACSCRTSRHNLQHLLSVVKDSQFLKGTIPMFVMTLGTNDQDTGEQNIARIKQIIDLHVTMMSLFPSSTVSDVSMAMVLLEKELTQLQQADVAIGEDVYESLRRLQNIGTHLQEKKRDGTLRSDNYSFLLGKWDKDDVEDFRLMSIFPTYEDVHVTELPFLRPNIVGEKFQDGETYLDTHFRLLREDFIKPLRDGIFQVLQFEGKDLHEGRFDDIRIYFNARIVAPVCTPKGILYWVKFEINNLKTINWESSKRLMYGSLVCLSMDGFKTILFATVANRDVKELQKGVTTLFLTEESRMKLAEMSPSDVFLMVETMAFFEAYRHVLEGLQEMSAEDLPMQRYIVSCEKDISPPGYLLAHQHGYSFRALLNDQQLETDPLFLRRQRRLLAAAALDSEDTTSSQTVKDILNFSDWPSQEQLGLDDSQMKAMQLALTKELVIIQGPPGTGKTYVGLKIVKALLDNADIWRSAAGSPILVVCYTNHALDQFLEGILKFMSKSSISASALVRVGGRSSSEAMKELSLNNLRKRTNFRQNLPGHLRAMFAELKEEREIFEEQTETYAAKFQNSAEGVLYESVLEPYILSLHGVTLGGSQLGGRGRFHRKTSLMLNWLRIPMLSRSSRQMDATSTVASVTTGVADLLQVMEEAEQVQAERIMEGDDMQKYLHSALVRMVATQREDLAYVPKEEKEEEEEEEGKQDKGWEIPKEKKKNLKNMVKQELQKKDHMLEEDAEQITDLWALPYKQRWPLYRLWLSKYRGEMRTKMIFHENEYQGIVDRMDELRRQDDETVLRSASVIGMTTTGAARYRRVLQDIQPRIVVVEEAAEVLEAHIITTLTSACQHLILIGDHQQLRPSATVYELARNFNLEVSLFERLIRMDVPYVRLDYQHRMRPEIAKLLTPHIYDKLENHSSVHLYENIKGVTTNLFFVDHEHLEEHIQEGRSHQNMHEATFVKALCKHLICQGYEPSQITVLTTYNGQLFCLKNIMPKSTFEGVNLCVVDRYQGEENDIVILSLVRSNKEGRVGFLNIPNRVCVALSRAKKALFCIGNMTMLSSVPLWRKINDVLSRNGQVGKALTLRCENHPDTVTEVSGPEDFLKAPLGGCGLPCEYRLDCGHVCTKLCHPTDTDHKLFKCKKPCVKTLCQDGHGCPKKCFEECGECQVLVTKTMPKCGHEQKVPCSQSLDSFECKKPCVKSLCQDGHGCPKKCFEECGECQVLVTKTMPKCGHEQKVPCSQSLDSFECKMPCIKSLCQDGHGCPKKCFEECGECQVLVTKTMPKCGHKQKVPCSHSLDSFKCKKLCTKTLCQDGHRCPKKCFEECGECQVLVTKTMPKCGHEQEVPCSQSLDSFICRGPCKKTLQCGHPCVFTCGVSCTLNCPQRVTFSLGCGHQRAMQCRVKQEADKNQEQIKCWKKCDAELDCGHACSGSCFKCAGGSAHLPCASPCDTQLICFHRCQKECKQRCVSCTKPCEIQCYHRKCPKLCLEACPPCDAPCGWSCKHHRCTRLCHEPCDRPPCMVPCYKKLKCGHSCIGMCGEPCPKKCRVCNAGEQLFGKKADPKARFVQLADCEHTFEVTWFDSRMASPEENGAIRPKSCPKCRAPIRRSVRYNAIVKSAQLDVEAIKKKAAVMLAEHVQSTVKEREKKGMKSPEIPPLLPRLKSADLGRVAFINEKIILLSQLEEINRNARLNMPMSHMLRINPSMQLCVKKVARAVFGKLSECQTEVKRILCLAEACALEGVSAFRLTRKHPKLNQLIHKLMDNEPRLSKYDMQYLEQALDDIAKEINPAMKWKLREDTEGFSTDLSCKFLKLAHWFKCSRGHVYYSESADAGGQSELCTDCLME